MEWEPNDRDGWVQDAERWICQIQGVLQCKIDIGAEGEVTSVHVVAGMDREPRHIVRDVEGLLKARLGVDVFYKKIGVVQVVDNDQDIVDDPDAEEFEEDRTEQTIGESEPMPAVLLEEPLAPRIICNGVGVLASDQMIRAEVDLCVGVVEAQGAEEGPNYANGDINLIAKATLEAVGQLLEEPINLSLSEIKLSEVAGEPVVLAAIELVEGRRSEWLYGVCSAQHNRQQAVVFAVLDALNRRLAFLSFKSGEVA